MGCVLDGEAYAIVAKRAVEEFDEGVLHELALRKLARGLTLDSTLY